MTTSAYSRRRVTVSRWKKSVASSPNAFELEAGVEPLVGLIGLMPRLRVLLLQGGEAASAWRRVLRRYPRITSAQRLVVVSTYHPGGQALWTPDPAVRQARVQHRLDAYRRVAEALN
jgi:hypothetical protein